MGRNTKENAPAASTYLVTKEKYRNFLAVFSRLAKLVQSEMHSGIALWGKTVEKAGDPYSYKGHLVMFPSGYGYYDLYGRNSIYQDKEGVCPQGGQAARLEPHWRSLPSEPHLSRRQRQTRCRLERSQA